MSHNFAFLLSTCLAVFDIARQPVCHDIWVYFAMICCHHSQAGVLWMVRRWQAGISVSQHLADLHVLGPGSKANPLQPGSHRHHKASDRSWWIARCLDSPELRPCSTTISTALTRAATLRSSTKLASEDMKQVDVIITSQYYYHCSPLYVLS